MKYLPGLFAGQLSGKAGNVVASRNKYGSYFRTRTMPTKVVSDYTNDVRGRLASLSQAYGALDEAERDAWRTWAATNPVVDRLGSSVTLQPSAAFIQLNARLIQAGGTQIDIPPIAVPPDPISGQSIAALSGAQSVTVSWTSGVLGAGECLACWIATVDSAGRDYYRNLLKLVEISTAAATTPLVVTAEYLLRFGTLIDGQRLFLEAEVWNNTTGLISGRVFAQTTVVAV